MGGNGNPETGECVKWGCRPGQKLKGYYRDPNNPRSVTSYLKGECKVRYVQKAVDNLKIGWCDADQTAGGNAASDKSLGGQTGSERKAANRGGLEGANTGRGSGPPSRTRGSHNSMIPYILRVDDGERVVGSMVLNLYNREALSQSYNWIGSGVDVREMLA